MLKSQNILYSLCKLTLKVTPWSRFLIITHFLEEKFQAQKGPILSLVTLGRAEAGAQVFWFEILWPSHCIKHPVLAMIFRRGVEY